MQEQIQPQPLPEQAEQKPEKKTETTGEPGRPSELTDEITLKIRERVLDGKKYVEIQQELGILPGTWDVWVFKDFRDFRKNLIAWKQERMIKKAEKNIEEMLDMPVKTLRWEGKGEHAEQVIVEDPALVRIKQDTSKFVLERLNKDEYSQRQEVTGKDGEQLTNLQVEIVSNATQPQSDNSIPEELPDQIEGGGQPGGDEIQQDVLPGSAVRSEGVGGEQSTVHDMP